MPKPIKRQAALRPLSREHHHGLLLCWKIKTGLKNQVEPERIKRYADWFFEQHLTAHFDIEERQLFPILGAGNALVQQAVFEHRRIEELFRSTTDLPVILELIALELDHHIRFEERVLFNEIQQVASDEQLRLLEEIHREVPDSDHWNDKFWEHAAPGANGLDA
ncbi:MAG: hemerythrin domain-containing protein [Saprospiraceae bacterium]|nr:hemerythrin domain-containing protein [Lewinellaceae bacterium]